MFQKRGIYFIRYNVIRTQELYPGVLWKAIQKSCALCRKFHHLMWFLGSAPSLAFPSQATELFW